MSHHTLDARRLLCPLPVIRTQNTIKKLQPGDTLEVICTDPGAESDIPTWCRINGHTVNEIRHQDGELFIILTIGND
jgi:tRNA 2-thiouridine synthesizing protein A